MFGVAASSTKPTFFGTMPAAKSSSEAPKFTGFGGTPSSESPWSSFASSFTGSELKQQPQLEKQDNAITPTAKTEKQDEPLDKQDEPTTPSESDNSSFDVVGDERYGSEDEHSGFDHYDEGSESDIEDEGTHDEDEDSADNEDDVTEHERDEVVEVSAVTNKTKAEEPAQLEIVEEAQPEEVKAEEVEPEGVKIEEVESEPQQQPSPQAEEEGMRPEDEIELAMKDIGLVVPATEDEPEDITVEESIEEPAPAFKTAETSDADALTERYPLIPAPPLHHLVVRVSQPLLLVLGLQFLLLLQLSVALRLRLLQLQLSELQRLLLQLSVAVPLIRYRLAAARLLHHQDLEALLLLYQHSDMVRLHQRLEAQLQYQHLLHPQLPQLLLEVLVLHHLPLDRLHHLDRNHLHQHSVPLHR
jgi:hypothetical protein